MRPTTSAPTSSPTRAPAIAPGGTQCPGVPSQPQDSSCVERSGQGYDAHQQSQICPSNSVVCAGDGDWEFADGSSITGGNNGLFSGTLSCQIVGTTDTVQISVREFEERVAYSFEVVGGEYAITAVNMKGSNEANFCTWPSGNILATDTLFTPILNNNPNNKRADLSHVDICMTAC
eukprot:CAMPEP_0172464996 /NCGR_PEP_ID=MMETSP1065-20121228/52172_1 /TAXON_ID=265537 /ORGANISM="Amphiprora paludosa, Strain CCMP125" /LENGTH=175 /DNA_ID=CAMNT_0013221397 /DNA_START=21 /DNA_END=548 /DNA_ORIENTATION=-